MPLTAQLKELLSFLQKNPNIRAAIAAPPNATMLYAGDFFKPVWKELEDLRRTRPELLSFKRMLPEILSGVRLTDAPYSNLLDWARALDGLQPWRDNGFIVWRALSGIYASNAVGAVSFYIGSKVARDSKVFAATELPVLLRNPNIDPVSKDLLHYYQRCIQQGQSAVNLGYMAS